MSADHHRTERLARLGRELVVTKDGPEWADVGEDGP